MVEVDRKGVWFDRAAGALAGLGPAVFAGVHRLSVPDAAHDLAVVRAVGGGYTGLFRALDSVVAWPFLLVPVGTLAQRAAFAAVVATGAFGLLLFVLVRGAVRSLMPDATRLGPLLGLASTLVATLGTSVQFEGTVAGGSVLGAVLAVAPMVALLAGPNERARRLRTAFLLGLAASYEPGLGLMALLFVAAHSVALRSTKVSLREGVVLALAGVAGLAPLLLPLSRARSLPELAASVPRYASPLGEPGLGHHPTMRGYFLAELGIVALAFAAVGVFALIRERASRPVGIALTLATAVGVALVALGAPAGPTRHGAVTLATVGLASVLAGSGMLALARFVQNTKVPFAGASATMILLLELAIPARGADDASLALAARRKNADAGVRWASFTFGGLPTDAAVLVNDQALFHRALALRAQRVWRADLLLVPLFDVGGPAAAPALAKEPRLAALYRDMALYGVPEEYSLSQLSAVRPVVGAFDVHWDRRLARHFASVGLFDQYSIEPRGPSDRRMARDAHAVDLGERSREAANDPELRQVTATLLRARAVAAGALGEREWIARTLDDLRVVAPDDDVAARLVRSVVTGKGGVTGLVTATRP